jgi:hypothetical protein
VADDIAHWLEGLGLGQYVQAFAENDIDFDILPRLSDEILKELGLSLGDRVRLQAAIELLSADQRPTRSVTPDSTPTEAERRHQRRRGGRHGT